jgi:hypothetical protein
MAAYGKHGKWARWRMVTLHFDHEFTASEILEHMSSGMPAGEEDLSLSTIYEVLSIFEETNDVMTPGKGHRVVIGSISARAWTLIEENINEDPTLFLDEMSDLVFAAFGERIPPSTLCQNLRRRNYTRRVLKQLSIKRQLEDEKTWAEMVARSPASHFAFIDYTHKNCRKLQRRHGYGQKGARTAIEITWTWGRLLSCLAIVSTNGKGGVGGPGGILDVGISQGNADGDMVCAMTYHKVRPDSATVQLFET